ncbi:lipopolysaccharide biosynthesis protein [Siminovitchia fordii]|uniref:lipopolysaccharide biosynthesis protein n=1 Tax=Siminovitchia fordii TaxID=254759 RepID=UPI0003744C8D|nr:oligosaccharide flippase family protein [Siminovitchia fordii]
MKLILNKIKSSQLSFLIGSNIVSQLILLLALPILARIFNPEQMGELSFLISLLSIFNIFSLLKYELALPLEKKQNIYINLLILNILTLVIFSFVLALLSYGFLSINNMNLSPYIFIFLPFIVFAEGLYNISIYYGLRNKYFNNIAWSKVNKSLITSTSQVTFGILNNTSVSLMLGDVLGRTFGGFKLIKKILTELRDNIKLIKPRRIKYAALKYIKFPKYTVPGSFLNGATLHLFPVFIAAYFNPYFLGIYTISQRITIGPMLFISQAVSQYYISAIGNLSQKEDFKAIKKVFVKFTFYLFSLSSLIALIIYVSADFIVSNLLGEQWNEAAGVIKHLSILLVFQFTVSPLSQTLNSINKQEQQFLLDLLRFILVVIVATNTLYFDLPFKETIKFYVYSMSISYLINYIFTWKNIKKQVESLNNR